MQCFCAFGVVCFVAVFFFFVNAVSIEFAKNTANFRLSIYACFNFLMCLTCHIFKVAFIQGRVREGGRGIWKYEEILKKSLIEGFIFLQC